MSALSSTNAVTSTTARRGRSTWVRVLGYTPLAIVVLVAIFGPLLVPYSAVQPVGSSSRSPSAEHWFGTDPAGMDILSRVVVATRTNLLMALGATVVATLAGVIIGLALGMLESRTGVVGVFGRGGARVIELLDAVPAVIIGMVAVAIVGVSPLSLVMIIGLVLTPGQSRLTRTEVLRVRGEAYLDAARQAGLSERRLSLVHVLPNASLPAVENTSLIFGVSIIITAALGFLGVGLQPPTPEWGGMISRGLSDFVLGRWWSAGVPAFAVLATVLIVAGSSAAAVSRLRR